MKKYTIHFNYYATVDIEVLADSEEEAIQKADEKEIPLEDFDLTYNSKNVMFEEEVEDLETLIEKASSIIRNYDAEERGFYKVDCYPTIISKVVWDGNDWRDIKNIVEDFYWDETEEKLGVIVNENEEVLISELNEMEQFDVCQTIINSVKKVN